MPLTIKLAIFAVLVLGEIGIGLYLWRRFMAENKPQMATLLAAQAAATIVIFAVILFLLLD